MYSLALLRSAKGAKCESVAHRLTAESPSTHELIKLLDSLWVRKGACPRLSAQQISFKVQTKRGQAHLPD
jgi:hypothetical protein